MSNNYGTRCVRYYCTLYTGCALEMECTIWPCDHTKVCTMYGICWWLHNLKWSGMIGLHGLKTVGFPVLPIFGLCFVSCSERLWDRNLPTDITRRYMKFVFFPAINAINQRMSLKTKKFHRTNFIKLQLVTLPPWKTIKIYKNLHTWGHGTLTTAKNRSKSVAKQDVGCYSEGRCPGESVGVVGG